MLHATKTAPKPQRGLWTYMGGCQGYHNPTGVSSSCLNSTNTRLPEMCPILSHRAPEATERQYCQPGPNRLAWSSKGILSVEDLRVAGMHWAPEPGLLSWGNC